LRGEGWIYGSEHQRRFSNLMFRCVFVVLDAAVPGIRVERLIRGAHACMHSPTKYGLADALVPFRLIWAYVRGYVQASEAATKLSCPRRLLICRTHCTIRSKYRHDYQRKES
jgi:hypothetical protein